MTSTAVLPSLDAEQDSHPGLLRRTSIAVVEDDEAFRALVVDCLSRAGFGAFGVADGHAWARYLASMSLHDRRPDIIVSDVRMPGCDGLQLVEIVQCLRWRTPVVLMTGFADQRERRQLAAQDGVASVLAKPFPMSELVAVVRTLDGGAS